MHIRRGKVSRFPFASQPFRNFRRGYIFRRRRNPLNHGGENFSTNFGKLFNKVLSKFTTSNANEQGGINESSYIINGRWPFDLKLEF